MTFSRPAGIIALTLMLAACGGTQEREQQSAAVEDRSGSVAADREDQAATRAFGAEAEERAGFSSLDDPASPLSVRILYFDYDSSEVLPAYREVLEAHANYLAQNPDTSISLEGHADERGSREYNLALGERRAQSVKRLMLVFGPSSSQIRTTSYGEERPLVDGHDDEAWSQNRRVEIIYPQS